MNNKPNESNLEIKRENILEKIKLSRQNDINKIKAYLNRLLQKPFEDNTKQGNLSNHSQIQNKMDEKRGTSETVATKKISLRKQLLLNNNHSKVNIIAELKPKSPSEGHFSNYRKFSIREIIGKYLQGGAIGLSILTEPKFFGGSFDNIKIARDTVATLANNHLASIPILMKDFLVCREQIDIAKILGTSNILVINKLHQRQINLEFIEYAIKSGVEPLIEIHDSSELEDVLYYAQKIELHNLDFFRNIIIGINNRNLDTLKTDFRNSLKIIPELRQKLVQNGYEGNINDVVIISESGINSYTEIRQLQEAGAKGFLIGSALMRADKIAEKLFELRHISSSSPSHFDENSNNKIKIDFLKICGIKDKETIDAVEEAGFNTYGIIVNVPKSPRNISINKALELFKYSHGPQNKPASTLVHKGMPLKEFISFIKNLNNQNNQVDFDYVQYYFYKSPGDTDFNDNKFSINSNNNQILPKNGHFEDYISQLNEFLDYIRLNAPELQNRFIIPIKPSILMELNKIKQVPDYYQESLTKLENLVQKLSGSILIDGSEGKGIFFNFEELSPILMDLKEKDIRIIFSGGINSENIEYVLKKIKEILGKNDYKIKFGIDISSGVEDAPGKKSIKKIKELGKIIRKFIDISQK
ncbi:MAG: hypothetical protein ACTSXF_02095 [Promethearchaeota archaeon]